MGLRWHPESGSGGSNLRRWAVHGVRSLGFGQGQDCTYVGALAAALTAAGVETTYQSLMGATGCCYRIAFCHPHWDPSSVDGLIGYDFLAPTLDALPFEARFYDRVEGPERQKAKEEVVRGLKAGRPSIGIDLRVVAEWGVIAGYDEAKDALLCRTYLDEGAEEYLPAERWPFLLMVLGEPREPRDPRHLLLRSLRIAVDLPRFSGFRNYSSGLSAYKVWAFDLEDDERFEDDVLQPVLWQCSTNRFIYEGLLDARRAAAAYLRDSVPLLPGRAATALAHAAACYQQLADMLQEGLATVPCPERDLADDVSRWIPEHRHTQAALLRDCLHQEMAAIGTLAKVVEML
jgi:hypothetical protein